MFALFKNILDDADVTLSASSEMAQYPVKNLLDDKLCLFTRAPKGTNYIQVISAGAKTVDSVVVAGTNASSAVLQISNDNFSTILQSVDIELINTHPFTGDNMLHAYFGPVTAKDFRVVFSGDTLKNVGKIFVGPMTVFPYMDAKQEFGNESTKEDSRSLAGCSYPGDTGYTARYYNVSFPEYSDDDVLLFNDLWNTCGEYKKPFFSVVWDDRQRILPMLYGKLEQKGIVHKRTEYKTKPNTTELKIMECF